MKADRKKVLSDGRVVEEYYWNGKLVVYIDNKKTGKTFNEVKSALSPTEENDNVKN